MKKIFFLIGLITMCSQIYSVTLDDLIDQLKNNGYSAKYRILEERQLEVDYKKADATHRDGIDLKGNTTYTEENSIGKTRGGVSAKYDYLKYEGTYDVEYNGINKQLVGVEKNLKDLIYGEREYNKNLYSLDERFRLNTEEERQEAEILALINTYKTLIDKKLELNLLEGQQPNLEADEKRLNFSLKAGRTSKLDYNYSKMKLDILNNNIKTLKNEIEQIKMTLTTLYNLDMYSDIQYVKLKELNHEDIDNIGDRSLDNIEIAIEKTEEKKNYSSHDNSWPDLNAGLFYDVKNDGWVARLSFDKTLFASDTASTTHEIEKDRLHMEREKISKSIENKKNSYFDQYYALINNINNLQMKKDVDEMSYKIHQLHYKQGNTTYITYIEKYEDFVTSSIALERKENELTAFLYEVKTRR